MREVHHEAKVVQRTLYPPGYPPIYAENINEGENPTNLFFSKSLLTVLSTVFFIAEKHVDIQEWIYMERDEGL